MFSHSSEQEKFIFVELLQLFERFNTITGITFLRKKKKNGAFDFHLTTTIKHTVGK